VYGIVALLQGMTQGTLASSKDIEDIVLCYNTGAPNTPTGWAIGKPDTSEARDKERLGNHLQSTPTLKEQIDTYLDRLSEQDQARVLTYARRLAHAPQGIPTQEFIDFFHQFPLSQDEKDEMQRIIEEIG